MRLLLAFLMVTLSFSCTPRKKKAATPAPAPTPTIVATPEDPTKPQPPPTVAPTPVPTAMPPEPTPEPTPTIDPIPPVVFDPLGVPRLPATPLVPEPHVILVNGAVQVVDPALVGVNLCRDLTVAAYYKPCGIWLCAPIVKCGYFVCVR